MDKESQRHPLLWLIAAITLGLVAAITAAGFDLYFKTPILEQGDPAVNAIQIDNAKRFAEIYGNYSRFEFSHPGPAFFYVYAAGEWLLYDGLGLVPSPHNAHLLACMALQSLFLATGLALLSVWMRWRLWLPLAILAAAVHFSLVESAFTSIWPPHVLLMPFLCFVVACISVASGRLDHLPVAVLVGGFLFHGHVAQTLFVGGLGGLAVLLHLHGARRGAGGTARRWPAWLAQNRRALAWSAGLGLLFLLPLALDVHQRGFESNVVTIVRRFLVNTDDSKSLLQALLYVGTFATYAQDQELALEKIGPATALFFRQHATVAGAWFLILAVPPVIFHALRYRLDRERGRFLRTAYLMLAATLALCVAWGLAQAGPMHHFNGYFYHGVYFLGLALALGLIAWLLEGFASPPAAGALCAVAAVILTWSVRPPRLTDNESGQVILRGVVAALEETPGPRARLLSFEHHNWPEAAAVALELQRRGQPFYTVPTWNFMFGEAHDLTQLGDNPEKQAEVWWITERHGEGHPITQQLSIHTRPPPVSPRGTEWSFARAANGFRHVVHGLSVGNVDLAWTEQPRVLFMLEPRTAETDVVITFDAEANNHDSDRPGVRAVQTAEVWFAGELIGRASVSHRAEVSLRIPRALWNAQSGPTPLELAFPHAVERRSFSRPRAREWHAWGLWKVRFDAAR